MKSKDYYFQNFWKNNHFTQQLLTYPVPIKDAEDYFVKSVGKSDTWKAKKTKETATYIFSNYACELEFLTKINNTFYLTPKGIQAILLLQLNRSLKLIESGNY